MREAVKGPRHDLGTAQALVAAGEYDYDDGKSCFRALLEELGSMVDAVQFIEVAVRLVADHDYCGSVEINTAGIRGVYDEYAFSLPGEVAERFDLRRRNWYLKFKITEVRGQSVFILSLHPLYKDEYRRRGGPLSGN